MGIIWVENNFRSKWPALATLNIPDDATHNPIRGEIERIQAIIDDFLPTLYEKEQVFPFKSALQQVEDGSWRTLGPKSFAYHHLPTEELKNLFVARLFPHLTIYQGRALIEKQFFSLQRKERAEIANRLYVDVEQAAQFFKRLQTLDLKDPKAIDSFYGILVNDALHPKEPEPVDDTSHESITLLNGDKITNSQLAVERLKRKWVEQPEERPNALMRWYILNIGGPYEGYWSDEIKRYRDEWTRSTSLHEFHTAGDKLQAEFKAAKTEAEKKVIIDKATDLAVAFNAKAESHSPDDLTPAVYVAAFVYGATPKSATEIAKTAGIGFVYCVLTRFAGGRLATRIIATDLGLRLSTAYYFSKNEINSPFGINLDKGYSIPFGPGELISKGFVSTAEALRGSFFSHGSQEKLAGFQSLGEVTSSIASFGAGAGLAYRFVDFSTVARLRKIEELENSIQKFEKKIKDKNARIREIATTEIPEIRERLQRLDPHSQQYVEVSAELRSKEFEIARLNGDTMEKLQRPLEFYTRQLLRLTIRIAENFPPLSWINKNRFASQIKMDGVSLLDHLNYNRNLGIAQYETLIRSMREKISKVSMDQFYAEALPAERANRRAFKRAYKSFLAERETLNTAIDTVASRTEEIAEKWKASKNPELVMEKKSSLAQKAIQKMSDTLEKFREGLQSMVQSSKDIRDFNSVESGSVKDLATLAELAEPGKAWGWMDRNIFQAENFRGYLSYRYWWMKEQPKPFETPSSRAATDQFFAETYVRMKEQLQKISDFRGKIDRAMKAEELPWTPELEKQMAELSTMIDQIGQIVTELRPRFDRYWSSRP